MENKEQSTGKATNRYAFVPEREEKWSSRKGRDAPLSGLASLAIVLPFVGEYGFAVGAVADIIVFLPPMLILVFLYKAGKKWLARRRRKSSTYVKTFEVEISERESTLAAMSIAKEKGMVLSVEGGEAFKEMCVELAAENDLKLEDPGLQERVEEIRASMPEKAK